MQGAFGFGFTLIAVSFFLLILDSGSAIQLLILIKLVISVALARPLWREADRRILGLLLLGACAGFPVGLALFRAADINQLRVFAGSAIIVFVFVLLVMGRKSDGYDRVKKPVRAPSALGVGALAGLLTTSLGMSGPALVLYLTAVGLQKDQIRAVALTFFAVAYVAAIGVQAVGAGVPASVWVSAAMLLPVAAVGAYVGHAASRFIGDGPFRIAVLALVGVSGVVVLVSALGR